MLAQTAMYGNRGKHIKIHFRMKGAERYPVFMRCSFVLTRNIHLVLKNNFNP
jgi:hypothetical protein